MGLDMYLTRKIYIGANWKHNKVKGEISLTKGDKAEKILIPIEKVSEIVLHEYSWRKANQIHKWFVDNCQEGDDDCREAWVSEEQLKELKAACDEVVISLNGSKKGLKSVKSGWRNGKDFYEDVEVFLNTEVAEDLLPVQTGFFFGGDIYDENYREDLVETSKMLEEVLKDERGDFYYRSSW